MSIRDPLGVVRPLIINGQHLGAYYSILALEEKGLGPVSTLPISLRIMLESLLRNYDDNTVNEHHIKVIANWQPNAPRHEEVPFFVSRVILQDFTGVPLLVDLAAMRTAIAKMNLDPMIIEPEIPVDLVIDHSAQVDFAGRPDAFSNNLEIEFIRNRERYEFLKWGSQAFRNFRVIPPAVGIIHQVNMEYLAKGIIIKDGIVFPDTLVGTDSHTTMINGLGIVGWGVGGIEAEACMLGEPISVLLPDVVGVYLTGSLRQGVSATDVALAVTEKLRKINVVGKFVEFLGPGAKIMAAPDRALLANMAPEYGATIGFFPVDEKTIEYFKLTARAEQGQLYELYCRSQGIFGICEDPSKIRYSQIVEIDLSQIEPSVAGPKRPQDRIPISRLKERFYQLLETPIKEGGYGKKLSPSHKKAITVTLKTEDIKHTNVTTFYEPVNPSVSEMDDQHPAPNNVKIEGNVAGKLSHGSIVIAAITSCTNTSNPSLMLAAGLLAKKAIQRGLKVNPLVKTSLAPGSRVVTYYLKESGLQDYLDELGFYLVGYGCTTCIGNSGPLDNKIEEAIVRDDLITVAVLSGNRNFEARVHPAVRANFLMSPPLVVAYAIAGRIDIDLETEPLGFDLYGRPVYLKDIWPNPEEVQQLMPYVYRAEIYQKLYSNIEKLNPKWEEINAPATPLFRWDPSSTYIQEPPYFSNFKLHPEPLQDIKGARLLALFGDSITTDHISPAGSIKKDSPAGKYLVERGVQPNDFNSYGARRGNHEVMIRGTFANVRLKNLLLNGEEGGYTIYQGTGQKMTIYDAAMRYKADKIPLIIIAGKEYGTGSSRDWAAKGTALLGVRAIIAKSFERIHRSNLIGMGVLPLQFEEDLDINSLCLDGTETFDIIGITNELKPQQKMQLVIHKKGSGPKVISITCRLDTPREVEYYKHGGILPFVLRKLIKRGQQMR